LPAAIKRAAGKYTAASVLTQYKEKHKIMAVTPKVSNNNKGNLLTRKDSDRFIDILITCNKNHIKLLFIIPL
jgi:hypothetical protein